MSTTKAKTSAKATNGSKAETLENPFVTKEFETAMSTGKKSLQDAFLTSADMAENAYKSGSDAFKTSFEKAIKDSKAQVEKATQTLADTPMYDKESAEPFLKAGSAVVDKGEKISVELIEFGSDRIDAYFAATRSVIEAEDVQKAIELQTEFARESVETFVSEVSKLNAMFVDASKTMMEPFGANYATSMDKFLNRA